MGFSANILSLLIKIQYNADALKQG